MIKKIGHNYTRDPYPWDGAEILSHSASWTCCGMNLPATYFSCPMCEKERNPGREAGIGRPLDSDGFEIGGVAVAAGQCPE
ncbi:hypothetical protein AOG2_34410 [Geobacter sp. AOG2]|nr:hypothetical protein AOG2_34410 [Geobacter sp. AOG2]